MNHGQLFHAIDPDGEKGSFAANVKILKSKTRQRMVWDPVAGQRPRLSLAVHRPGWSSFGASLLLHAGFVATLVIWAPVHVAHVIETYVVEIATAPPQLAFSSQPSAASPKQEEPPKPPEPKKELPPPPQPDPVVVAAKPPPTPPPPAPIKAAAAAVSAPLRIAVASAPAPQRVAVVPTHGSNVVTNAHGGPVENVADPTYVSSIRDAIAHQLRYPELALRRGVEGRVVLRLTLTASGHLLQATSGEPPADVALTNAALAAVRRAAPFPPWHGTRNPEALLSLILPIRFKLDEH